jgi:hypothetical protein
LDTFTQFTGFLLIGSTGQAELALPVHRGLTSTEFGSN